MGHVIERLSKTKIPKKPTLQATRMIVEKCENIHIHYRNMRLELSDKEFFFFARMIREAEQCLTTNFKAMQGEEYSVLSSTLELDEDPEFFPERITVEANLGSVHVHYKNLRLELTKDEAKNYFDSIKTANKNLDKVISETKTIPLSDINPFDGGHIQEDNKLGFSCHQQKEHLEQIEKIKKAIREEKSIRPIAVLAGKRPYQRMDGFCRYIAHKQLGRDMIKAIICPLAYPGCQDKKSFIVDKEEFLDIINGEKY